MNTPFTLPPKDASHLHPAFDMRPGLITFGFSIETTGESGKLSRGSIHIVNSEGKVNVVLHDTRTGPVRFKKIDAELKNLDGQWEREHLVTFANKRRCLSGPDLYESLKTCYRRHVEFDDHGKFVIVICWALMTFVYLAFGSVPFLHLLGDKGTGKSQLLDLLNEMSKNGHKSRTTTAAIGDLIESWRVIPLIDQADNLPLDQVDLLADSYRANVTRTIINMDKRGCPQEFEVFGPKAFAGTQYLHEDLADRVILITTTLASQKLEQVRSVDADLLRLRSECYAWAMINGPDIRELAPFRDANWPGLSEYHGRQRDLWLPIECIMEALTVPIDEREAARAYYRRSQASTKAELPGDKTELLLVLRCGVGDMETWSVARSALLAGLRGPLGNEVLDDEDWTPRKLGKQLKALNVLAVEPRRIGRNTDRQYVIDGNVVRTICKRYGITE